MLPIAVSKQSAINSYKVFWYFLFWAQHSESHHISLVVQSCLVGVEGSQTFLDWHQTSCHLLEQLWHATVLLQQKIPQNFNDKLQTKWCAASTWVTPHSWELRVTLHPPFGHQNVINVNFWQQYLKKSLIEWVSTTHRKSVCPWKFYFEKFKFCKLWWCGLHLQSIIAKLGGDATNMF